MKESLDKESRDSLIAYRIERAYGSLKEARLMARGEFYNAAINRLYYSCYYMAVALLLKHNISAQTHSGVKTMLGMHFTSKGQKILVPLVRFLVTPLKMRELQKCDSLFCLQDTIKWPGNGVGFS